MLQTRLKYVTILIVTTLIIVYYFAERNDFYMKLKENDNFPHFEPPEKLFNLNFQYVLNNRVCNNEITAVIIVTSYFGNIEARSSMRRAFSRDDLNQLKLARIFLLGISPTDKYTTQKAIENENSRFRDIVQGNFIEAYRNLTYKHVMGLKWVKKHCMSVEFVIKMDDDTVVNIERLPILIDMLRKIKLNKFIAGYVLRNMVPIREPANKWFVTRDEYSQNTYPQFVSGWFYITTPQVCSNLYTMSQATKYFWIDDTYITGILAKKLKSRLYDISKYFTVHSEFIDCCVSDVRMKNLDCDIMIGPNGGNNNLFYTFNNALGICNLKLCKSRTVHINETCVAEKKINLGRGNPIIKSYKLH